MKYSTILYTEQHNKKGLKVQHEHSYGWIAKSQSFANWLRFVDFMFIYVNVSELKV